MIKHIAFKTYWKSLLRFGKDYIYPYSTYTRGDNTYSEPNFGKVTTMCYNTKTITFTGYFEQTFNIIKFEKVSDSMVSIYCLSANKEKITINISYKFNIALIKFNPNKILILSETSTHIELRWLLSSFKPSSQY